MDRITQSNYEPLADIGFEQTLARVGHINRVIDVLNTFPSPSATGAQLIGTKIGFDMNSVLDQTITLSGGSTFVITDVIITNPSLSMTTAKDFAIFTAASRGGSQQVSSDFGLSGDSLQALTGATSYINKDWSNLQTFLYINVDNTLVTSTTVYASLGTAQGAAATADIYVYGYVLA